MGETTGLVFINTKTMSQFREWVGFGVGGGVWIDHFLE